MAELLLATLYLVSEAPPDKPASATAEARSETAPAEPAKDAGSSATATALADAAKAMDTAEKQAETASAAPTTSAAAPAAATNAAPPSAAPTPLSPSAAANTSGMHLQYVAPGVARQSFLESYRYPLAFMAMALGFVFLMFHGGGLSGGLAGPGSGGGEPTPQPTQVPTSLQQPLPPPDDTSYEPLANRMPASDLTVNAGAINGKPPLLVASHGDAGANKGGYKDERADLDAAEAMVATNPDKALAMVDKHDRDYPRGILDPDARIVRIEAFQKKGDDAKALALADEFLQDYPHSPRAGRVQSIAEQIKNKGGGGNAP